MSDYDVSFLMLMIWKFSSQRCPQGGVVHLNNKDSVGPYVSKGSSNFNKTAESHLKLTLFNKSLKEVHVDYHKTFSTHRGKTSFLHRYTVKHCINLWNKDLLLSSQLVHRHLKDTQGFKHLLILTLTNVILHWQSLLLIFLMDISP